MPTKESRVMRMARARLTRIVKVKVAEMEKELQKAFDGLAHKAGLPARGQSVRFVHRLTTNLGVRKVATKGDVVLDRLTTKLRKR